MDRIAKVEFIAEVQVAFFASIGMTSLSGEVLLAGIKLEIGNSNCSHVNARAGQEKMIRRSTY